jgi:hypothetical protein
MVLPRSRTIGGILRAVGAMLVLAGVLATYASRTLFDGGAFARRLAGSLEDERVATYVADRLTEAIVVERPDLVAVRPVLVAGVRALIQTDTFRSIVEYGAREAHRSVLDGTAGRLIVSLPDFGAVLRSALATNPTLGDRLPPRLSAEVGRLSDLPLSRHAAMLLGIRRESKRAALGVLVLGGLVSLGGILLAPTRRRALLQVGEAWLGLAVVLMAVPVLGGFLVGAFVKPAVAPATSGVWVAFTDGLEPVAWVLALVGIAMAAAVSSLETLPDVRTGLERLGRWIDAPPGGRLGRAVRSFALIVLGTLAVVRPSAAARGLALLLGALLAFIGLRELFALALPRAIGEAKVTSFEGLATRAAVRVGSFAGVVVCVAITVFLIATFATAPVVSARGCNGSPALCPRPLDQVVFPGSHNSMAAGDVPDWLMPNHERGIAAQLADGVRALLIDVMPGIQVGDRIRTELASESAARAKYVSEIGEEGIDAALRIRDRLVPGEGATRGLYVCHGFCELGATPLAEVLKTIRTFLVTNPGEVLLVIVQDEGVTADELAVAAKAARLADQVYRGPFAAPWPTLQQLVEADTRLLLFVEHDHGDVPWIPNAYDVFQETPYAFPTPEAMTCAPNRGDPDNSLFLVNHFIAQVPPLPSAAAPVNTRDFLVARARQCWSERGRVPTILAIDFYRTGDLFAAARELNGLAP